MKNKLKLFIDGSFVIFEIFMRCIISVVILFVLSKEEVSNIQLIGVASIFWILYPIVCFFDKAKLYMKKKVEDET